jgi:alkylation response protein AidB-like acyl-CoA dehydrogenase
MALLLTEEQRMLRDSARGFLAENAPVAALRKLRDTHGEAGFSATLWEQFAEMGFTGILVPEARGGLGLGHVEVGVVMEEIGRNLTVSPFVSSGVVAVSALRRGSDAQQQRLLPTLASGEKLATLAVDEGAKHRPLHTAFSAKRQGDGFRLDGTKTFVVNGQATDLLVVAARTSGQPGDASGLTLFLVDRKAAGVQVEAVAMVDTNNAARLTFEGVVVSADAVLGEFDDGLPVLRAALDAGRAAAASELLGIAEEVFARTLGFLKERQQFGKVIGEFQALQHRAATLYIDIEITRSAVLKAQQALDENAANAAVLVSIAKSRAGTTATLAVQEGVQMHGGMGMTDDFDMGLFMKRARVLQEWLGDAAFHADQLALSRSY